MELIRYAAAAFSCKELEIPGFQLGIDDFLLHTITDEREIKILFELLEKRNEQRHSTIVCSQQNPDQLYSVFRMHLPCAML
ncbi:MAG TPA: hypothetical protein DDY59_01680 [Lachnospiraceae bacterium]|jgi:DNA replication protein DnaC|nr:hypothetical protein [Lachnospiraceae bacterium]